MIAEGGWILALLAVISLIAWTRMILEWLTLRGEDWRGEGWVDAIIAAGESGDIDSARRLAESRSGLLADTLAHAAQRKPRSGRNRRSVDLLTAHRRAHDARLDQLGTYAAVAPLLGLLGTLLGMVATFDALATDGQSESMTEAIRRALITTQAGLVVALPILVGRGYLTGRLDRGFAIIERYHHRLRQLVLRSHHTWKHH